MEFAAIVLVIVAIVWFISSFIGSPSPAVPKFPETQVQPPPKRGYIGKRSPSAPERKRDFDLASIELNDQFQAALRLFEQRQHNVFVTGRAGTGKSTLLKYFRATANKSIVVLAPTGIAAINVSGQTIHSFFKFPPRFIDSDKIQRSRNAEMFRKIDVLVIDEVSMVRADLMDGIDVSLRINRGVDVPFGGVQTLFFGDLFQLPPVVREREVKAILNDRYGGPYFFQANVFKRGPSRLVDLNKIYRQKNADFLRLLNNVREGSIDHQTLQLLNSRVAQREVLRDLDGFVTLTTTNEAAWRINSDCLARLPGKQYEFHASVWGTFEEGSYPTEETLTLKKGAHVMMIKNDPDKRWVNGTLGTIAALSATSVSVEIYGSVHEVPKASWEKIEYVYDREVKRIQQKVVGRFEQLPLRLAWAITIHKSQGQTLERVYIDLGQGAFAHGQTYVALSRCPTLEGVALSRPVTPADIIVDSSVNAYRNIFSDGLG